MASKVVFNADAFFDFDKSTLKPEGRQLLDQVAQQAQGMSLETIIAVGHNTAADPGAIVAACIAHPSVLYHPS